MSIQVAFNGSIFNIPEPGDSDWGEQVTLYLTEIASATLTRAGGLFELTDDIDFGLNYGLIAEYYVTRNAAETSVAATKGSEYVAPNRIRLGVIPNVTPASAVYDAIAWRNNDDDADLRLLPAAGDETHLQYDGVKLVDVSSAQTLTNKTFDADANTLTNVRNGNVAADAAIAGTKITPDFGAQNVSTTGTGAFNGMTLTAALNMSNNLINNLTEPVAASDAATKAYVDSVATGLNVKASVRLASTVDVVGVYVGSPTFTLTTAAPTLTLDGSAVVNGDRVLLKNQTVTQENGIYLVSGVGATVVLTRTSDANSSAELTSAFVFVQEGSTYADTGWVMTTNSFVLDVSACSWSQFSGAGTYTASTGLVLVGTDFRVGTSGVNGIDNSMVNTSAAIAGTKISPNFGSQAVLSTGTFTGASFIPTSSSVPANGLYLPAANTVGIAANTTEIARFLSSSGANLSMTIATTQTARLFPSLTDGSFSLAGSPTSSDGANVLLYGETHASSANDIDFRSNNASRLLWDFSDLRWESSFGFFFQGRSGIGGFGPQTYAILEIGGSATPTGLSATNASGVYSEQRFDASVQTVGIAGFTSAISTQNVAGTVGYRAGFRYETQSKGAASTITRDIGLYFGSAPNQGGTGNALIADNLSFSGTYLINFSGTGLSQFAGPVSAVELRTPQGADNNGTGSLTAVSTSLISFLRFTNNTAPTIHGFANGIDGKYLIVSNTGSGTLTVANQSTTDGTAANRIITGTGADLSVAPGASVKMIYDDTTDRWRVVGGSGASGTTTTVTISTAIDAAVDNVLVDQSAAVTMTLPTSPATGKYIKFKDRDGVAEEFNITLLRGGSSLIDGQTQAIINVNYGALGVLYDGTNWSIV